MAHLQAQGQIQATELGPEVREIMAAKTDHMAMDSMGSQIMVQVVTPERVTEVVGEVPEGAQEVNDGTFIVYA